jgi:hypothetical protein
LPQTVQLSMEAISSQSVQGTIREISLPGIEDRILARKR